MIETTPRPNPISEERVVAAFRQQGIPANTHSYRDYERCKKVIACIGDRDDYEAAVRIAVKYTGV